MDFVIKKQKIICVNAALITSKNLVSYIHETIDNKKQIVIDYLNAHTILQAYTNSKLQTILNGFDILHSDGIGMYFAINYLAGSRVLTERLNGTDFYYTLIKNAEEKKWKIFLLGSTSEIVESAVRNLLKQYPMLHITGFHHGYNSIDDDSVIDLINNNAPDLLLIGMGVPQQEYWINQNRNTIHAHVLLSVGGGIEFLSGLRTRAPKYLRAIGFEWLFRLFQEPRRLWKRYIFGIPHFVYLCVLQKIGKI